MLTRSLLTTAGLGFLAMIAAQNNQYVDIVGGHQYKLGISGVSGLQGSLTFKIVDSPGGRFLLAGTSSSPSPNPAWGVGAGQFQLNDGTKTLNCQLDITSSTAAGRAVFNVDVESRLTWFDPVGCKDRQGVRMTCDGAFLCWDEASVY